MTISVNRVSVSEGVVNVDVPVPNGIKRCIHYITFNWPLLEHTVLLAYAIIIQYYAFTIV
jgi:hypothetical protein